MNEDLTAVVDAVATKIGMAADALVPITETLVREVAGKHELLFQWNVGCAVVFLILFCLTGCIGWWSVQKIDNDKIMDAVAVASTSICIMTFLALVVVLYADTAIGHAAKAAAPTLTLLESVLK